MAIEREKLSGYLDGQLSPDETVQVETALETDAELRAELEQLMVADSFAKSEFEAMLKAPVSMKLAATISSAATVADSDTTSTTRIHRRSNPVLAGALAASLALLLGGVGGYLIAQPQQTQVAAIPGWLTDIGDYHRVYAAQVRHLVEVGADESDHIEKWLSATIGARVRIPDLSKEGLEFKGARLLVAAGKPVAQLMFTDVYGKVVALCLIASTKPNTSFQTQTVNGFDMVTWGGNGANFVIIGDEGRSDLSEIAKGAAAQI